jgi:hypothetical protein
MALREADAVIWLSGRATDRMDVRAAASSLFLLAILCARAHAVDGVIAINQARALAGGVTPGDAPGFPVIINAPGSYRLTGDLTVPDANIYGIFIDASFVQIDLTASLPRVARTKRSTWISTRRSAQSDHPCDPRSLTPPHGAAWKRPRAFFRGLPRAGNSELPGC